MFSRDPLQNLDLLKPETYHVTNTLMRQLATVGFCLLVGVAGLYFLATMFDELGRYLVLNMDISFSALSLGTFIFFFGSALAAAYVQFSESALFAVIRKSWKYQALWIGVIPGLMMPCFVLREDFIAIPIFCVYHIIQTIFLTAVVIIVPRIIARISSFEESKHLWLMSAEANLWACKAGVLPYYEKLQTIWGMIFASGFILFFMAVMAFAFKTGQQAKIIEIVIACLIALLFIIPFLKAFIDGWQMLTVTNFLNAEGKITKSMTPKRRRKPAEYKVHCQGQDFSTSDHLWRGMYEGSYYRLWYIIEGRHAKVIAFEKSFKPHPAVQSISTLA